jgi:hypothetical protein
MPGRTMSTRHGVFSASVAAATRLLCTAPCHPVRSDPAEETPASEAALQVAYEAGLWQLLELFFLSADTPEGFFAEARHSV